MVEIIPKNKKLKLYGKKDNSEGFIADITEKDSKILVKSKSEKVEKELSVAINQAIKKEFFHLPWCENKNGGVSDGFSLHKPGDPQFLEALRAEFYTIIGLGQPGEFGNKKFDGYKIISHKSEIVEICKVETK